MTVCPRCDAISSFRDGRCQSCGWSQDPDERPVAPALKEAGQAARAAAVRLAADVLSTRRPDGGIEAPPWPGDVAQLAQYIVTGERDGMDTPKRGEG